jgi:hypothetical protein
MKHHSPGREIPGQTGAPPDYSRAERFLKLLDRDGKDARTLARKPRSTVHHESHRFLRGFPVANQPGACSCISESTCPGCFCSVIGSGAGR